MYYCIVYNINDKQCQRNAFLLKFVYENTPHVMLAVDNFSILSALYILIYLD